MFLSPGRFAWPHTSWLLKGIFVRNLNTYLDDYSFYFTCKLQFISHLTALCRWNTPQKPCIPGMLGRFFVRTRPACTVRPQGGADGRWGETRRKIGGRRRGRSSAELAGARQRDQQALAQGGGADGRWGEAPASAIPAGATKTSRCYNANALPPTQTDRGSGCGLRLRHDPSVGQSPTKAIRQPASSKPQRSANRTKGPLCNLPTNSSPF